MIATCIEDNDGESHVLHEVHQSLDGVMYSITLSAEAPDLALRIAQEIPLTYWKQIPKPFSSSTGQPDILSNSPQQQES
jgi:hypothetical protein